MKTLRKYIAPIINNSLSVALERDFLVGSNVEKRTTVETGGHQFESHDFQDSSFNHEWK